MNLITLNSKRLQVNWSAYEELNPILSLIRQVFYHLNYKPNEKDAQDGIERVYLHVMSVTSYQCSTVHMNWMREKESNLRLGLMRTTSYHYSIRQ
jgi:hypothetical protein